MKRKQKKSDRPKIVIGMATIGERSGAVTATIDSLVKNLGFDKDLDELHVYANDYEVVNTIAPYVHFHNAPLGDLGDSAFMYPFIENEYENAYFFIVGDDVIYPPSYLSRMIQGIDAYDREAAISLHGRTQVQPLRSYYNDITAEQAINGFRANPRTVDLTVLGTAYAAWHSSLIDFTWDDFPQEWNGMNSRNMGDIWYSKKLCEAGIRRIAVPHAPNWVQHNKGVDLNKTIARTARKDDAVQTALFNSVEWVK